MLGKGEKSRGEGAGKKKKRKKDWQPPPFFVICNPRRMRAGKKKKKPRRSIGGKEGKKRTALGFRPVRTLASAGDERRGKKNLGNGRKKKRLHLNLYILSFFIDRRLRLSVRKGRKTGGRTKGKKKKRERSFRPFSTFRSPRPGQEERMKEKNEGGGRRGGETMRHKKKKFFIRLAGGGGKDQKGVEGEKKGGRGPAGGFSLLVRILDGIEKETGGGNGGKGKKSREKGESLSNGIPFTFP